MGLEPIFYLGALQVLFVRFASAGEERWRIGRENRALAKDQQLQALVAPAVTALGFELWGVEYITRGREVLLRVYIDHEEGVDIDDCAAVSRQVSALLDVEDPIQGEYVLEVSSPGMDRPLFTLDQFVRFSGEQVKVKLRAPFEGRRNFSGRLVGVEGDEVVLVVGDEEYLLPIELIDKAHVVPQFERPVAPKGRDESV